MDETASCNRVVLCGIPAGEPTFSHASRGERFYTFPLEVLRLSGTADRINIILRESLLPALHLSRAGFLRLAGELRSFNNRSGEGSRLVVTVFVRTMETPEHSLWENRVELEGTLCREPTYRATPLGREISDLLLAVNRPYGRSDYLPCIAWGANARLASGWTTGTRLRLDGRIQSRGYIKNLDGQALHRVAYEVSASEITLLEQAQDSPV